MYASDGALGELDARASRRLQRARPSGADEPPFPDLPVYSVGQICSIGQIPIILTQISRRTNSQLSSLK
jgi:hypothetical protein